MNVYTLQGKSNFFGLFYDILEWDNRKDRGAQAERSDRARRAFEQRSIAKRASPSCKVNKV
jgi:hypothetical protein